MNILCAAFVLVSPPLSKWSEWFLGTCFNSIVGL